MDDWTAQLDSGGQVDVIYTDLAKAFDTVPHQRLLLKIKTYNIDTDLLLWITDFLCNKKQCVVLNGEKSSWFSVLSGIPPFFTPWLRYGAQRPFNQPPHVIDIRCGEFISVGSCRF